MGQLFTMTGTVTGSDSAAQTITVNVIAGSQVIRPYVGQDVVVLMDVTTYFLLWDDAIAVPITFDDLEIGTPVSVGGQMRDGAFAAWRITTGASLTHWTSW